MKESAAVPWLSHPLAGHLLRANFLPSSLAHPGHIEALAGAAYTDPGLLPAWPERMAHRLGAPPERARVATEHALSRALIEAWHLEPIAGPDEPGAFLCLLPPEPFNRLALHLGLVFLAPAVCRVIARTDIAMLQAALGTATLQFTRRVGLDLRGVAVSPHPLAASLPAAAEVSDLARAIGIAVVAQCFSDVPEAVGRRGLLRLPPDPDMHALPPALDSGALARPLASAVLQLLEPEWLSHFRVLH